MKGVYDPGFVLLSLLVAALASYTALSLAGRISAAQNTARQIWLAGGAISMGLGVWSMHFVGMLAFSLPIPLGYDLGITALSLVFAIVASYLALNVSTRPSLGLRALVPAGLVMGAGIGAMHYTGMAAMRMDPSIRYDPFWLTASLLIAAGASMAALWIVHRLREEGQRHILAKRLAAALVMALAITGMHYSGMAAAHFAPGAICGAASDVSPGWLGAAVTVFTVVILGITLILSMLERRFDDTRRAYTGSISRLSQALRRMETVDPLTELPNRSTLLVQLDRALTEAVRRDRTLAVLFMDLDGFKTINDSLGHAAGDELLKAFAERLRQNVRRTDVIGRIGGDEFVVILEDLPNREAAGKAALAILSAMQRNLLAGETSLMVTPSIGIASYPGDADSADALLRHADIAMYAAKQEGRNAFRFYHANMGAKAMRQLAIQQGLQHAMANGLLKIHFQPKFDGLRHGITGAEALLRWTHPTLGEVPPSEFIPVAERSGQIVEIGFWVVREVCRQLKAWQASALPEITVAVNLSPKQLYHPGIADLLRQVVQDAGFAPGRILFEITETVAMQDAERTAAVIRRLHECGFGVAIDDFGTGYSSLAYLQQFRVQQLKIDRFFTQGLDTHGDEGKAIVSAIVALAHALNMEVVAEGVETQSQVAKLRDLACDQLQGFLLAHPLAPDEFLSFMQMHQPDGAELAAAT